MRRLVIKPQWTIGTDDPGVKQHMPVLLRLLASIYDHGSLRKACDVSGVSYRYAWGIIKDADGIFGVPLVHLTRGQGATLTTLGERLVWADRRITARLSPILDGLAAELATEFERARVDASGPLRIHASHGYAVVALRDFLAARDIPVELRFRTSVDAYASMEQGKCDIAGFHVSTGALQAATLAPFMRLLKPRTQTLISLITRRQGLMVAAGNPKSILAIDDLARPGVRFVNRQHGSGTRALLEVLLERGKVDIRNVNGFEIAEFTHDAVAAYVASGMADVGFGVEPGARKFHLDFVPLATERYFLACHTSAIATPLVRKVLEILCSNEFRVLINDQRGLDSSESGTTMSIEEAFQGFAALPVATE